MKTSNYSFFRIIFHKEQSFICYHRLHESVPSLNIPYPKPHDPVIFIHCICKGYRQGKTFKCSATFMPVRSRMRNRMSHILI